MGEVVHSNEGVHSLRVSPHLQSALGQVVVPMIWETKPSITRGADCMRALWKGDLSNPIMVEVFLGCSAGVNCVSQNGMEWRGLQLEIRAIWAPAPQDHPMIALYIPYDISLDIPHRPSPMIWLTFGRWKHAKLQMFVVRVPPCVSTYLPTELQGREVKRLQ